MAHVLFGDTTAIVPLDPDVTAPFDSAALLEEQPTEQTPAIAMQYAYLVEVRCARGVPRLLAIRDTFEEARLVAQSYLQMLADVRIREVPLPCDVSAFLASDHQVYGRDPAGNWTTV